MIGTVSMGICAFGLLASVHLVGHWMKFFFLPSVAVEAILSIKTAINNVINDEFGLYPLLALEF